MGSIAFDTLKFAKRLKEAGFTDQQAEALASVESELIEEKLATKRDIVELKRDMKELETVLKRDMKELETVLKRDMKELEYRMIIKLGTLMVVAVSAVAALVKLL